MPGRKPVVQCTAKEWKEMTRKMQACCPPPEGYVWHFVWSTKVLDENKRGDCERRDPTDGRRGKCVVRVAKGLSETETSDILIHEVAHAFDMWTHHSWSGDHGSTFWIWVGRIFRRYWGLETG